MSYYKSSNINNTIKEIYYYKTNDNYESVYKIVFYNGIMCDLCDEQIYKIKLTKDDKKAYMTMKAEKYHLEDKIYFIERMYDCLFL